MKKNGELYLTLMTRSVGKQYIMHFLNAQKTVNCYGWNIGHFIEFSEHICIYSIDCQITNNNKCNLCTTESESIELLVFFYCNKSKQLWMQLEYLI